MALFICGLSAAAFGEPARTTSPLYGPMPDPEARPAPVFGPQPNPSPTITPVFGPQPEPTPIATPEPEPIPEPPPEPRRHFLHLALDISRFDYKEDFPPPGRSTENGTLPGLWLQYRGQETPTSAYWTGAIETSFGGTRYSGTIQPSGAPHEQDTGNRFVRLEAIYGHPLVCGSDDSRPRCLKAYFGHGGRYWKRGFSHITQGVATPSEHYLSLYLPLGLRLEQSFGPLWSLALDASVRWMFHGGIIVRFSEISTASDDASATLGRRLGGRVELPLRRKLLPWSDTLSLELTPWLEYSQFGQSQEFQVRVNGTNGQTVLRGYEPPSRTWEYGARLGIVFNP